jgi:C2 domain
MESTRCQVSVYATKLPRMTRCGCVPRFPNPYAVLRITDGPPELRGKVLGRTETLLSTCNPDWVQIFYIDLDPSQSIQFSVAIYDDPYPPEKLRKPNDGSDVDDEYRATSVRNADSNNKDDSYCTEIGQILFRTTAIRSGEPAHFLDTPLANGRGR